MSVTLNNTPATTQQTPQQAATGNLSNEFIFLLTPGLTTSVPANSSVEITLTTPGTLLNDFVEVNKLNHVAGLSVGNARIAAVNTMNIQMVNSTATPIALQTTDQYLISLERPLAQSVLNGLPVAVLTT